jgi:membrane-associated protease RseP (regulator of RpoE activity)
MAFLNLFNLLPINPLDGGQIFRSITLSINKSLGLIFMAISVPLAVVLLLKLRIGLFAVILIAGLIELIWEIVDRKKIRLYQEGKLDRWALPAHLFKDGKIKSPPADLTKKQFVFSIISFVFLVWINKSMAHISGAEMATTFLE